MSSNNCKWFIYLRAYIWYAIYYSSHICFYYTCFSFIYNRTIIQTSFRSSSSLPQAVPSAHHQGTLSVSPATRSQRALSIRYTRTSRTPAKGPQDAGYHDDDGEDHHFRCGRPYDQLPGAGWCHLRMFGMFGGAVRDRVCYHGLGRQGRSAHRALGNLYRVYPWAVRR